MAKKFFKRIMSWVAILLLTFWLMAYATDMMVERSAVGYVAVYPRLQESTSGQLGAATTDNKSSQQRWDLSQIMAPQVWPITSGRPDVLVAVLDTGVDSTHPDLAGKVVANINFTRSLTAADRHGHGTHIAGIVAASARKATGTTGLAYNCSLLNVKVAEDDGSTNAEAVAKGIIWAAGNGAKVINISLVINKSSPALEAAVYYAWNKGGIIVAAAGNNYSSAPVYPAAYLNVIAVAATDQSDRLPRWSNHGDWISVGAPGVNIYSTLPGDKYAQQSGTSLAAALVSGEAALLFSIATDTNGNGHANDEVFHAIKGNCDKVATDVLGQGRINVLKAVRALGSAHRLD